MTVEAGIVVDSEREKFLAAIFRRHEGRVHIDVIVTVRDLRNRPCEVSDRVLAGEGMTITREGTPVADLRGLRRGALDA